MVEGRKTVTSCELKKSGVSWQLDTSNTSASEPSRPPSTCTTPKAINIKRSASSLATSLINSLGGGSTKKSDTTANGRESPTPKSSGSSFTAASSGNSFSAGPSASAISSAAAASPASPSIAGLQQAAGLLTKSTDMSSASWSGISSTAAMPSSSLVSLTDPGALPPTRFTHKPGQGVKLLPDAVFIPDAVAHKHTLSGGTVAFLEPASSDLDDGGLDDSLLPGSSQSSSHGGKLGNAPLMRLGSSSLAATPSQRMLSGTTPTNSAAGGSVEAMLRQKSRVSFLIDEGMHGALKETFGSSCSSSNASAGVQALGYKNCCQSSNDYKHSNTTGIIGMKLKADDLMSGRFSGDPEDSQRSAAKKDVLSAFAKLTASASGDGNGASSISDSKVQALAYKHQIGYLPSPSASSGGNRQSFKHATSGKSSLSWAGTATAHSDGDDEETEENECLLPALPPGAIPSFTAAGSGTAGVSNISSSSTCPVSAAVKSAKALNPSTAQLKQQQPSQEDCNQQRHSAQLCAVQIPRTVELLPAHIIGPTLLAVSGRLSPAMQRSQWCMADFVTQKKLYDGYASSILKAFDRVSGSTVALKLYHLNKLNTISSHQVAREVRLHIGLDHENIIGLYAAFQEAGNVVLVQDFAPGGDLWSFIDTNSGRLTERVTVSIVLQPFLKAIQYLHTAGIAHRDIKPENVLFTSNMVLKVADFGLAVNLREERAVTRVGTLDYMAPEVLRCPLKCHPGDNKDRSDLYYSQAVDAWAVGVLAYELLTGRAPFSAVGASDSAIEAAIQVGGPAFPSRMSEPAVDFIAAALDKQPDRRPSILQMLHHPWIRSFQRSSSNGRAEQRSSQECGGTGRLLIQNSGPTVQAAMQQRQQQQERLPQLTPPKGQSTDDPSATATAADVYHTDDNGLTGFAISGGW